MDKSHIRNASFTRVIHFYYRQVMSVHRHLERLLITGTAVLVHIDHIRQKECRASLLDGICQIAERLRDICTVGCRLELDYLTDDMEQMASSFLRRNELLDLVAEEQGTDLVIVYDGGERQHCSNLRKHVLPAGTHRTEKPRTADIHKKHHGQFPLLFKDLHIRRTEARSDVPVHIAHIIAILVLAHLAECHTTALEGRMVLTGEYLMRQSPGLDLYLPDLLQKVVCTHSFHYGTSTAFMISEMIWSVVMFSASASYVRPMRWRSTS